MQSMRRSKMMVPQLLVLVFVSQDRQGQTDILNKYKTDRHEGEGGD